MGKQNLAMAGLTWLVTSHWQHGLCMRSFSSITAVSYPNRVSGCDKFLTSTSPFFACIWSLLQWKQKLRDHFRQTQL